MKYMQTWTLPIAETNFELTQDLENLQDELNTANEKISDLERRVSALESTFVQWNPFEIDNPWSPVLPYAPATARNAMQSSRRTALRSYGKKPSYKHLQKFR